MSESSAGSGDSYQDGDFKGVNQDAPLTAGALLRSARESRGLHIAALAVALKVPVKKLEALESDQYELLPDAVFTRALACSVCRTLKIDAAPVLAGLPQKSGAQLNQAGGGINTPFRGSNDGTRASAVSQISRPAILAGIALLLGAVILIFLPSLKAGVEEAKTSLSSIVATGGAGASLPHSKAQADSLEPGKPSVEATGASPSPAVSPSDSASVAASSGTVAAPGGSLPSFASATISSTLSGVVAAAPTSGDAAAVQDAAKNIVVFTAKSTSWVEVTDSTRQVVLRRTLNPGESGGATGVLPLTVIVGRADATDVLVRGKVLDLSGFSKNNVARFEVK